MSENTKVSFKDGKLIIEYSKESKPKCAESYEYRVLDGEVKENE